MLENFYTKRFICRKIKEQDVPILTEWSNSQIAYGDYLTPENTTLEENLSKLKNNSFWNDKSKTYLVETKEEETPIGIIKYWTKSDSSTVAMIALKIAIPEHRRKGYGTEIQKALIRELFKKYKFDAIEMYTDINNIPQQKCLEKLDFENIKTENYVDSGTPRQGHLYRLTKERYEKSGVHIFYYE